MLDHLYSCLFGTFLFNSDKERRDNKLQTRWADILVTTFKIYFDINQDSVSLVIH